MAVDCGSLNASPGEKIPTSVVAKSKKGGITCNLADGPDGMTVTPAGEITWSVPKEKTSAVKAASRDVSDRSVEGLAPHDLHQIADTFLFRRINTSGRDTRMHRFISPRGLWSACMAPPRHRALPSSKPELHTLTLHGSRVNSDTESTQAGHLAPGPDGHSMFTAIGRRRQLDEPIEVVLVPGTNLLPNVTIPSTDPTLYLSIQRTADGRRRDRTSRQP